MRTLASIQTILSLDPIPNADRIVLATVRGWQCVVDKGQFNVGDKAIYFEIDSVVPAASWNDRFRKEAMHKPLRIKTRQFRGQISQGLCFDLSILPAGEYEIGQDVTDLLGVIKYEPPVPAELAGNIKGNFPSSFISRTDEERLQNCQAVIQECIEKDLEMVGTLKCDGCSSTFGFIPYTDGRDFVTCSRNMNLSECDNTFWQICRKYDIQAKLSKYDDCLSIQGEIVGPGIQSNRMGLTSHELRVFNVKNITQNRYLNRDELEAFCAENGLVPVPVVYRGKFTEKTSLKSLLDFAATLTYDSGHPAEGVVWRPAHETFSDVLHGRMSFKTVSNLYLLKIGE